VSRHPHDTPLLQKLTLQEIDTDSSFNAEIGWRRFSFEIKNLDGGKTPLLDNLCYSVNKTVSAQGEEVLDQSVLLKLYPVNVKAYHGFTERDVEENIYPPSAKRTYGRLMNSDITVRRILQKEVDSNTHWLCILNEDDARLIHHHPVFEHEVFYHSYKVHTDVIDSSPQKHLADLRRFEFWKHLEEAKVPSWEGLYKITDGYDAKNFRLGKNMRDTVEQLVPSEWPSYYRDMYSLALCAILSPDLMTKDPLDFVDGFIDSAVAHTMIMYHYTNIVRGITTSDIVRTINNPKPRRRITVESKIPFEWVLPLREIESQPLPPQTRPIIIRHALKLTNDQSTKPTFPVTWKQAKQSREMWNERVTLIGGLLTMTGRFNPERLGLRSLLYLGGAYRWPHRHSTWTAEAVSDERHLQIQEFLLPPQAVEKVKRFLKRVFITRWYSRRVNYHTFEADSGEWKYDPIKMARQVERRVSMKRIAKDFSIGNPEIVTIPDSKDAIIIDALSHSIKYHDLERSTGFWDTMSLTPAEFELRLKNLVNEGMIHLSYQFHPPRYASRCLVLQGDMGRIRSLAYTLLENAPTCSVYLFDDSAFIIVSLHPDKMDPFIKTLVTSAIENDVLVEPWTVNRYSGYRWGLLQRLLCEDGTWDEDISGLLCQGRGLGLPLDTEEG